MAATDYAGYRISFGHAHPIFGKFFAYGYKSHFSPTVGSLGSVSVPFKNFTDFWDDATGEPIHTVRGSRPPWTAFAQGCLILRSARQMHVRPGLEAPLHVSCSLCGSAKATTSTAPMPRRSAT